ncbi:hypothetical protein HOE67_00410 [Candidatus Peregrinibacteria bacterium]|jgi:hypothetical protein|nr:hypothetical protein [Candidatus Peregrinibacteria bacterium]MBT4055554.1 hypothetical protein [Candidatus Peregrinibacteria bacterium]
MSVDVPGGKTRPTAEILGLIANRPGAGGRMTDFPVIENGGPEAEARDELVQRLEVVLRAHRCFADATFSFDRFSSYQGGRMFVAEIVVNGPDHVNSELLRRGLLDIHAINDVSLLGVRKYRVVFNVEKLEGRGRKPLPSLFVNDGCRETAEEVGGVTED